ncbi:MAG: hypothetical protein ACP5IA_12985 [Sediminispirochaetaceae bacterium]
MKSSPLTSRVLTCRETGEGRPALEREIALASYRYIQNNRTLSEDEAGDFFCYCYPKLTGLIDNFTYQGRPFEAYLYVSLRWHLLHYKRRINKQKLSRTVFSISSFWEVAQYQPDCCAEEPEEADTGHIRLNATSRKRMIYLALRESEYLTHAMVEEIITITNIDRRWFLNCVMALKARLERRRMRLEAARRYRNRYFYHYHVLQIQLRQCSNPEMRRILESQLLRTREKLARSTARVQQIHVHPTNREISEVLNVPKGTIDSGIYYLRNSYAPRKNDRRRDEAA